MPKLRIPKISEESQENQKKLIVLKNPSLVNNLLKVAARTENTTESAVAEKCIIDTFLKEATDFKAYLIWHLFEDNGIAKSLEQIFNYYSYYPSRANDTLLPLVSYLRQLELRHETELTGKEKSLDHLLVNLNSFSELLQKYLFEDANMISKDYREYVPVPYSRSQTIKAIADMRGHQEKMHGATGYFSDIISVIYECWNLGGDAYSGGLKNSELIYNILKDICHMGKWPCYSEYQYDLMKTVKDIEIEVEERTEIYDVLHAPILSKVVHLDKRTLLTTKNAVIITADKGVDTTRYRYAKRLIHGPYGPLTDRPYIILYNNEETLYEDLRARLEELKIAEFKNLYEVYPIFILENGIYHDQRIKWHMI